MKKYRRVLTIAGSDSGGGAGIQADLKTFAALECFGMSVLTAVTAQNTRTVHSVHPIPPADVTAQLEAVVSDIGVDAVKIGMLFNQEIIEAVASGLSLLNAVPVILDPVMCSKAGSLLLERQAVKVLKKLFPLCLLITPNLMEASELLGRRIDRKEQMPQAAFDLMDMGAHNVLLKGGHLKEERGSDCFCTQFGEVQWFTQPIVKTHNNHGTGCTLSSAIAALLAKQYSLIDAIHEAKRFLHSALLSGAKYELGSGCGPLHHFHALWRSS